MVLDPYDRQVKSIFFGEDQSPLTPKGGVVTITEFLIGKPGTLQNFKPKLGPNVPGFWTGLADKYARITKILSDDRENM